MHGGSQKRFVATGVMIVCFLSSCAVYHPQSVDIPLVDHRGEVRADVAVGTSFLAVMPNGENVNATATWAVGDWYAAQLHANYAGDNYYLQFAPGVYGRAGERFVMECYAGMGYGGVNHRYSDENDALGSGYRGYYLLPFAQVNAGWRRLGAFEVGFGLKMGCYMPNMDYFSDWNSASVVPVNGEHYDTYNLLLEPQMQVAVGGEQVKFHFRIGYAWLNDLVGGNYAGRFTYDRLNVSLGLGFSL